MYSYCLLVLCLLGFMQSQSANAFVPVDITQIQERAVTRLNSDSVSSMVDIFSLVGAVGSDISKVTRVTEICGKAKEYAAKRDAKSLYYGILTSEAFQCGAKISTKQLKVLKDGLESDSIVDIYYASQAIFTAVENKHVDKNSFEWLKPLATVFKLMEEDGTFRENKDSEVSSCFHAGLAWQILGGASKTLPDLEETLREPLRQVALLVETAVDTIIKNGTFDFTSGNAKGVAPLALAAEMLQGIDMLQSSIEERVSVTHTQMKVFADFLLLNRDTVIGITHLSRGLNVLAKNGVSVPLYMIFPTFSSEKGVVGKIGNIFGTPLSVDAKVVIESCKMDSTSLIKSKTEMKKTDDTFSSSELNKALTSATPGIYNMKFTITPKLKSGVYGTNKDFTTSIKVFGKWSMNGMLFVVSDTSKVVSAADTKKQVVSYPKEFSEQIRVGDGQYLHFKIQSQKDATVAPQQVFVQVKSVKTGKTMMFSATKKKDDFVGKISLSLAPVIDALSGEGDYELIVFAGSSLIKESFSWKVGTIYLALAAPNQVIAASHEHTIVQLPEIHHQFPAERTDINFFMPMLFSLILIANFGFLVSKVLGIKGMTFQLPSGTAFISTFIFQGSILGLLLLNVIYWLQLNIFQAFIGVGILGMITLFSGAHTLRYMAAQE